jgi:hypothetical protein
VNIDRQIHRQREAARRSNGVRADAVAFGIACELVENEHRSVALGHQFRQATHI